MQISIAFSVSTTKNANLLNLITILKEHQNQRNKSTKDQITTNQIICHRPIIEASQFE